MNENEELPDGWTLVRLADHTTVKARLGWKGLKAEEYIEDGYVFLATPNLKGHQIDFYNVNYISKWRYDESPEIQLRDGDVLLVKDGSTLGTSNLVRKLHRPATVNGSIAVVRTHPTLLSEYLYQVVKGDAFQFLIQLKKAGLGVPHLFQADLREFFVKLPPKPQQRKIATILTTVDNLIERTEALIAKYQALKQGLMHDLFTRGVDAHGQLRPSQVDAPELYKESALGWIPKEWTCDRVAEHISGIEQGWSPDCESDPAESGEWGVLKTTAVDWDGFDFRQSKKLPPNLKPTPEYEVKVNDILMTRAGPNSRVGVVSFVESTQSMLILSDKIYRIVPRGTVTSRFLAKSLSCAGTQTHLSTLKTGLAESQTNISQEIVKRLWIAVPRIAEQKMIDAILVSSDQVLKTERENQLKLRVQKSGLMQDLLTGNVRVKVTEGGEVGV